jgi:hypothetical protein
VTKALVAIAAGAAVTVAVLRQRKASEAAALWREATADASR